MAFQLFYRKEYNVGPQNTIWATFHGKKKQISILHQYLNNFLKELFYATMTDNIAQDLSSDINHNEDL